MAEDVLEPVREYRSDGNQETRDIRRPQAHKKLKNCVKRNKRRLQCRAARRAINPLSGLRVPQQKPRRLIGREGLAMTRQQHNGRQPSWDIYMFIVEFMARKLGGFRPGHTVVTHTSTKRQGCLEHCYTVQASARPTIAGVRGVPGLNAPHQWPARNDPAPKSSQALIPQSGGANQPNAICVTPQTTHLPNAPHFALPAFLKYTAHATIV